MIFNNVNEAFIYYVRKLKHAPESSPRGMKIKECIGESFTVLEPRSRITNNTIRQMSLSFAFGEFCWYLRGSDRLNIMEYYSKIYPQFSDDKVTVNGAYGKRIFGGKCSQWEQIKTLLKKDPDSRQAVISIHQPSDLFSSSKDIPCTCVIQFFIRDGKLNAVTYMRSNDIFLGMPYDIFSFTMLQEMLALELNVQLGTYTHMVGSLHIYEEHFGVFDKLKNIELFDSNNMPCMTKESISDEQISLVLRLEQAYRENDMVEGEDTINPYWCDFIKVLRKKNEREYLNRCESIDYEATNNRKS